MVDLSAAPLVSLIMSMRDGATTIEAAIRSVIWQTFKDWELILIDDGSRDDGAARATAFGDPRIRIIRHEESRGPASRRNEAIRLARGELIAVMDADDINYPERLAVQVDVLRSDPKIDVLAARAVVFRRQGEIAGVMPAPTTHDEIVARPYRGFPFVHPTWCGKASWFQKHQYAGEMWPCEDQELLLRAASTSRFATADKILLGYRKEHIGLSKSFYGRLHYSRAIWRHARQSGTHGRAATDTAFHFAKFAAELVTTGVGVEEWLLKQKLLSWTPEEAVRWRTVWSDISKANENPRPVAI